MSCNHDGSRLASASYDRTVRIWSLDETPPLRLEHPAQVLAVAWSPDGTQLVAASARKAHVWSASGAPGIVLEGHEKIVHSVAWSPDGRLIATASDDGTIRLWNLNVQYAIERICATAGGLTPGQWNQYIPKLRYQPSCIY